MRGNILENSKEVKSEVNLNKIYHLPKNISAKMIFNKYLVISPDYCNWLVFETSTEYEVFKFIYEGKSIQESLNKFNEEDVISVVTQIEAKKFEEKQLRDNSKRNIYIYLTNNCNLRCKHCYMYSGDKKVDELDFRHWTNILNDFKEAGGNGVTFTGGEVLMYKWFSEIIEFTHNLGLSVTVLSNGLLWSSDKIRALSKYIDEIQISLDGYDSESYKRIRKKDGFNKAISTIKEFSKTKTHVCIAATPIFDSLDDFVNGFSSFSKKFIKQYPNVYIKLNMELIKGREVNLDEEENMIYNNKIRTLTEQIYPNFSKKNFVLNFKEKNFMSNCGFGEISIAPNGDVYWCNRIFELPRAINIKDYNFSSLFKLSDHVKFNTDVNHSKVCSLCDIKYICGGGCRLKYPNIDNFEKVSLWNNTCPKGRKEKIYKQMIDSNEYFFEE